MLRYASKKTKCTTESTSNFYLPVVEEIHVGHDPASYCEVPYDILTIYSGFTKRKEHRGVLFKLRFVTQTGKFGIGCMGKSDFSL